jgi:hypothetical protein
MPGRIERIALDLASGAEVSDVLGDRATIAVPSYQVAIRLDGSESLTNVAIRLRPGMLVEVRFPLRQQRLITLILAPLRRWLG